MTTVLGIDPGTEESAYCLLRIRPDGADYGYSGKVPSDAATARSIVLHDLPSLIVIEEPKWLTNGKAAHHLFRTAYVAGMWEGVAQEFGITVRRLYVTEWRKHLTGKSGADDADVKPLILRRISGFPARSNNHERDAAGVALIGGTLPAAYWTMREARAEMKAKRTVAKGMATKARNAKRRTAA